MSRIKILYTCVANKINHVNIILENGFYRLLGLNGAGKNTWMNLLLLIGSKDKRYLYTACMQYSTDMLLV